MTEEAKERARDFTLELFDIFLASILCVFVRFANGLRRLAIDARLLCAVDESTGEDERIRDKTHRLCIDFEDGNKDTRIIHDLAIIHDGLPFSTCRTTIDDDVVGGELRL